MFKAELQVLTEDRDSYPLWACLVKHRMRKQSPTLWEVVEHGIDETKNEKGEHLFANRTQQMDEDVMSFMLTLMETKVGQKFTNTISAKNLWEMLLEHYKPMGKKDVTRAIREIMSLHYNGSHVIDLFNEFDNRGQELEKLELSFHDALDLIFINLMPVEVEYAISNALANKAAGK
ncbi:hypothetical protein H4R20_000286 [Coemansia guatemalensis]|uniref:Uncharacterized protein n=1 Tax=Coemansia guatemalensis TaxID=2761395 RepID=A0A9W8LVL2_9FUNG|nr:hypothetical protein H4R20_000286 [Coemansia guatemalensis]